MFVMLCDTLQNAFMTASSEVERDMWGARTMISYSCSTQVRALNEGDEAHGMAAAAHGLTL